MRQHDPISETEKNSIQNFRIRPFNFKMRVLIHPNIFPMSSFLRQSLFLDLQFSFPKKILWSIIQIISKGFIHTTSITALENSRPIISKNKISNNDENPDVHTQNQPRSYLYIPYWSKIIKCFQILFPYQDIIKNISVCQYWK